MKIRKFNEDAKTWPISNASGYVSFTGDEYKRNGTKTLRYWDDVKDHLNDLFKIKSDEFISQFEISEHGIEATIDKR